MPGKGMRPSYRQRIVPRKAHLHVMTTRSFTPCAAGARSYGGEHQLNQLYGSGLAFGYYSNGTAAQLAALWDFCLIFIRCLIAAAAGVTGSLILRALARQLENADA